MRFPDALEFEQSGGLKRLWYKIICPFTHGARLWMVITSIICVFAVLHTVAGSWGYHGNAKNTGFLSGDYVNGVRLAWQIEAADAGLDRIDDYVARDGYLFLVGYRGSQRIAVGYDASHSTPRQLWHVDVDDEPGVHWWDGDLLVGNTLISPADGKVTTGWPSSSGLHLGLSPYEHASTEGWSTAPIGPVRFYCPDPATGLCEAWDKTATHVWNLDTSGWSFPDNVAPVDGWVPLLYSGYSAYYMTPDSIGRGLAGFLNLNTGEHTGLESIAEACEPALVEYEGTLHCTMTEPNYSLPLIRARDGWVISNGQMNAAAVAPDGSNARVVTLSAEELNRLSYLTLYPSSDQASLPTTEEILHYAATGERTWEADLALVDRYKDNFGPLLVVNGTRELDTKMDITKAREDSSAWWSRPAMSRDASVVLMPRIVNDSPGYTSREDRKPLLFDTERAEAAQSEPFHALRNDAVPGWNDLGVRSATPLYDDLIVARVSPETSPWYKRLLGLTPSSGDHIVGLTPAPGPMRSVR